MMAIMSLYWSVVFFVDYVWNHHFATCCTDWHLWSNHKFMSTWHDTCYLCPSQHKFMSTWHDTCYLCPSQHTFMSTWHDTCYLCPSQHTFMSTWPDTCYLCPSQHKFMSTWPHTCYLCPSQHTFMSKWHDTCDSTIPAYIHVYMTWHLWLNNPSIHPCLCGWHVWQIYFLFISNRMLNNFT